MPNGDPNFEITTLPKLERFFAPITPMLEEFAAQHNLRLWKYYHRSSTWCFDFRHPAGGVASIQVLPGSSDSVRFFGTWEIRDYDNFRRRTWSIHRDAVPLDGQQVQARMVALLKEILAQPTDCLVPDGANYEELWRHPEEVRASELALPLPILDPSGDLPTHALPINKF